MIDAKVINKVKDNKMQAKRNENLGVTDDPPAILLDEHQIKTAEVI